MKTKKHASVIINSMLLFWFLLDMIGISFSNHVLVSQSWKDDGIFMIIYIISFFLFIFKNKIGKYILSIWLFMWFITQILFHWYFTIFGPWEGKVKYFSGTIKLVSSTTRYIPDLYHIVEHVLILFALVSTAIYCLAKGRKLIYK